MTNFKPTGVWRLCIAVFTCLLCLFIGVAQASSPFFWDSIDVDITLETDGDLLITETQKYVFTQNHTNERYRYIPLNGIDTITDVAVYENNEPLPVETGTRNNNYWIQWQHPLTPPATHTFRIQYRVVGAIQAKGNRSQIYWNALFPERSAAINRGQVTVHVPEALVDQVTNFQGEGVMSRDRQINSTTYEFVANHALEPQQALNIRIEFPSNVLNLSQVQKNYWSKKESPLAPFILWILLGSAIVSMIGGVIAIRKRCPNCGQFALKRTSRVVKKATRYIQGRREVKHTCQRCNYDRRFNRTIPRKASSSSGSSYGGWSGHDGGGWSGGDGGGSGCGGGGCGGGGCGGGGCGGGG